jgi:hypothetical protein
LEVRELLLIGFLEALLVLLVVDEAMFWERFIEVSKSKFILEDVLDMTLGGFS